jgi:hypothetical protein
VRRFINPSFEFYLGYLLQLIIVLKPQYFLSSFSSYVFFILIFKNGIVPIISLWNHNHIKNTSTIQKCRTSKNINNYEIPNIYATTEGQTRKIARFMEDELKQNGHKVT